MGKAENFTKNKLIVGILSTKLEEKEALRRILTAEFGTIDYESQEFDFNFTNYYI